jgi:ABC transport system ATP-binding/permease protein
MCCCWTSLPTTSISTRSAGWKISAALGRHAAVCHPRPGFLQRLATRIVELDRGRCSIGTAITATFLQRKEAMLAAEQEQNVLFDKKLAQEEAVDPAGIEARRTRNEGRVRALKRCASCAASAASSPAKCACRSRRRAARAIW